MSVEWPADVPDSVAPAPRSGYLSWSAFKGTVDKYLAEWYPTVDVGIEYIDISWPTSIEDFVVGVEKGMLQVC